MNEHKRNEWIAVLPKDLYSGNERGNTAQLYQLRIAVKDVREMFYASINRSRPG